MPDRRDSVRRLSFPSSIPVVGSPEPEEAVQVDERERIHHKHSIPVISSPGRTGRQIFTNAEQTKHSLVYTCVIRVYGPQSSTSSWWVRSMGLWQRIHSMVLAGIEAERKLERLRGQADTQLKGFLHPLYGGDSPLTAMGLDADHVAVYDIGGVLRVLVAGRTITEWTHGKVLLFCIHSVPSRPIKTTLWLWWFAVSRSCMLHSPYRQIASLFLSFGPLRLCTGCSGNHISGSYPAR